jgi:triphosphoribosyl-dephospho-CoA synthase
MSRLAFRVSERLPERVALHLASQAHAALLAELHSWPKPGLVSHIDRGSHSDMDWRSFVASATAITPFFALLAQEGSMGADMIRLREIGCAAETAMLAATGDVNTHRGAIFALGLLCAAAGALWSGRDQKWIARSLCQQVKMRWGAAILGDNPPIASHGTAVQARYGAGGARAEAAQGFPNPLRVGLPALRLGRHLASSDQEAARIHAFFALMEVTEDSNLLHRGGHAGLLFAQSAARDFLAQGGVAQRDWRDAALRLHHGFIARKLSPGGCADLLAISLFLDQLERGE